MQKVTENIYVLVLIATSGIFLLAGAFIYFYVRYQRKLLTQRAAMQLAELQHRESLLNAAIQSQEDERKRIGRDLHDDVGSALSNLRMVIGEIVANKEPETVSAASANYKPLIDNIITNVRNISHSLSPPGLELFGLEHTLHELCDNINLSGNLKLSLDNKAGEQLDDIGVQNSLAIYRVIQELVANTMKHANAGSAAIVVDKNADQLLLHYKDDGKGFDTNANKKTGMGLQNIESRLRLVNATYRIESAPGKGFNIFITLPVKTTI